jgi:hypothetical protein
MMINLTPSPYKPLFLTSYATHTIHPYTPHLRQSKSKSKSRYDRWSVGKVLLHSMRN